MRAARASLQASEAPTCDAEAIGDDTVAYVRQAVDGDVAHLVVVRLRGQGTVAVRALATGDNPVSPRLCDLQMLLPAITGKVEMVYEGEQQGAEVVARRLVGLAVKKVFDARFPEVGKELGSGGEEDKGPYAKIVRWFAEGNAVTLSDEQPFAEYEAEIRKVPGLFDLAGKYIPAGGGAGGREERCFTAEMILEGLHQHLKLARQDLDSQVSYKEMVKFQLLRPNKKGGSSGNRRGDIN